MFHLQPYARMTVNCLALLASVVAVSGVSHGVLDDLTPHANEPVKKLIIDTDAGVDDGVAILNILGAEQLFGNVKVELITTVTGNTNVDNVGKNVLKILKTMQRLDIPVYRGANESILYTPEFDNYFGEDGFGNIEFPNPPPEDLIKKEEHAANVLVETVSLNPGDAVTQSVTLTLVCLGPLTNIALASRLDPKFLSNVKEIFVLGGSDSGVGNMKPGVEFNFYIDPEAAYITFEEAKRNKKAVRLLTWETAYLRSTVDMAWRKNELGAIQSPQVELINEAEKAILKGDDWVCTDAALSAVVLDSDIVDESAFYHVDVELCGKHSRAVAFMDYEGSQNLPQNVLLIKRINVDKFKKMLLQNLNHQGGLNNGSEISI